MPDGLVTQAKAVLHRYSSVNVGTRVRELRTTARSYAHKKAASLAAGGPSRTSRYYANEYCVIVALRLRTV